MSFLQNPVGSVRSLQLKLLGKNHTGFAGAASLVGEQIQGGTMFFKTKESLAHVEPAVRAPRYASLAMISINGFEGYAVIKNVNMGGFRMESKTFVDMEMDSDYSIQITPEAEAQVETFTLQVKVCWVQSFPEKCAVGFQIVRGGGRQFEKYVEFLKKQDSET